MEELLHQASHFNSMISQLMQNVDATSVSPHPFTLPDLTSPRAMPGPSFVPTVTDMRNDYLTGAVESAPAEDLSQTSAPSHIPTTSSTSSNAGTPTPSSVECRSNERPFPLPEMIQTNKTRQVIGMKEFSAYRRLSSGILSLSPWTVTDMQAANQSVQQLRRNLEQAFQLWNISTNADTACGKRLLDERTIRCVALVPVILLGSF